jgi:hypothetical protein
MHLSNFRAMTSFLHRPLSFKKFALTALLIFLALAVAALLWLAWNARPVSVAAEYDIATPAVPAPNGFDLYRQAELSFRATTERVKPALSLEYNAKPDEIEDPKKYPLSGKKQWLSQNRRAFELFDQARKADCLFPPVRSPQPDGEIVIGFYPRWLARYVAVECEVLAAEGKHEAAVQRALDIWEMSLDISRGAPLIVSLESLIAEVYARRALDGEIAHLGGAQAKRAAQRLEKLLATRVTYRAILQEERSTALYQTRALLEKAIYDEAREKEIEEAIQRGETDIDFTHGSTHGSAPARSGPVFNWVLRRHMREYERGVRLLIAGADATWPQRAIALPSDLDPRVVKLMNILQKSRFFHARNQAQARLTLARLAIHAFRKDTGVYPQSLQELAPKYLPQVPRDPFGSGETLRYKRDDKRYKLWSIGPDVRDDNGVPAVNTSARRASSRHAVTINSTGDIVANISR